MLENELISRIKKREYEVENSHKANKFQKKVQKGKSVKDLEKTGQFSKGEGIQNTVKAKAPMPKLAQVKNESKNIINNNLQGRLVSKKKIKIGSENNSEEIKNAPEIKKNNKKDSPFYLDRVKDKFRESFNNKYSVSLLGVVMGQLDRFSQKINKNELIFGGKLKNRSFYKYLYSIDDSLITKVDWKSLSPVIINLEKNENGSSAVSVQRYFGEKVVFFENVLKKGKKSSKERSC